MKKISYIKNQENCGVSKGWNQGLKTAINQGSNYYIIVNNDIVFDEDCIDILLKISRERNCLTSAYAVDKKNNNYEG